jgi:hypothetical protein
MCLGNIDPHFASLCVVQVIKLQVQDEEDVEAGIAALDIL